jgi:hypothetical protein
VSTADDVEAGVVGTVLLHYLSYFHLLYYSLAAYRVSRTVCDAQ